MELERRSMLRILTVYFIYIAPQSSEDMMGVFVVTRLANKHLDSNLLTSRNFYINRVVYFFSLSVDINLFFNVNTH